MGLQQRKQKTKQRILESAELLFRTQGFAKTTMSDVARKSELGVGTLYNYYPSKTELMIAIFSEPLPATESQMLVEGSDDATASDKLKGMTERYLRRFLQHDRMLIRESVAVALGIAGDPTNVNPIVTPTALRLDERLMQAMEDVIRSDIHKGRLPETLDISLVIGIIHGNAVALVMAYMTDTTRSVDDMMHQFHRQIDFLLSVAHEP